MNLIRLISKRGTLLVKEFAKDESGATAIEYGLIATLIGIAIIGGASAIGYELNEKFRCTGRAVNGKRLGKRCEAALGTG